ncbi:S8 family peptidase [Amycolatopsis anabasis]|uniref:S8 family peptidase n=1 Tax=Amycolatopsis anabasis TaxID=1840409 RepID=UPI001FE9D38D|nr:S8 family peptidase [Amycolatopsis anabasis]
MGDAQRWRMRIRGTRKFIVAGLTLATIAATTLPAHANGGEQPKPPSWGLDRIDQRENALDQIYRYETRAETVTAYIVDTGIDAKNPEFAGRVDPGKDFVDNDDDAADDNGHGTHLAGIVGGEQFGVAKGVRLVGVRVLDKTGSGSTENIIKGIDWVTQNARQPAVAILGLGGGPNDKLDDAVRRLAAVVPVAVPAGGSGSDASGFSPARVAEALTVGASDPKDAKYGPSNYGSVVDLFAPGANIPSVVPGKPGSVVFSGTSPAAAFVTGAAALYRALHPEATAEATAKALVDNATKDKLTGLPNGTANRLLYTLSTGQ